MRRFTVRQTVDAPRERVFDYLADVSNYAQFMDHYLGDLRLERLDSTGRGASFSFQFGFPLSRQWGDLALERLERPHEIVARGRTGRIGRVPIEASFVLTTAGQGMTRVEYSFESRPARPIDRLREPPGMRSWMKSNARRALRRLADALEQGNPSAAPISTAAG